MDGLREGGGFFCRQFAFFELELNLYFVTPFLCVRIFLHCCHISQYIALHALLR
jgi:hypothetical protein